MNPRNKNPQESRHGSERRWWAVQDDRTPRNPPLSEPATPGVVIERELFGRLIRAMRAGAKFSGTGETPHLEDYAHGCEQLANELEEQEGPTPVEVVRGVANALDAIEPHRCDGRGCRCGIGELADKLERAVRDLEVQQ